MPLNLIEYVEIVVLIDKILYKIYIEKKGNYNSNF